MKGINNKIKILCKKTTFKNSIIVVQSYLKETMTSSLLRKITTFKGTTQGYTLS